MSAEDTLKEANGLFVDEDYTGALELYNKAITLKADYADAYVKRAACYIKVKKFTDAITDAKKAIDLDPSNATAYLRKGIASFHLDEYESALQSFTQGELLDANNKHFKTWARKCQAEIDMEDEEENEEASGEKEATKEEPKKEAPKAVIPPTNQMPKSQDKGELAPLPGFNKIRHEWFQSQNQVTVTIFAKKVKAEDAKIDIRARSLEVTIALPSGKEFQLDLDLCDEIIPDESKTIFMSTKIEIRLRKKNTNKWLTLERNNSSFAVQSWDDSSQVNKSQYPSSSKKKVNWDAVKVDDDEEVGGDAALNKVFKDIYGRGSDEQRRAMMKSFYESNGTVLSTNWDDVGNRYVEGSPPDGMEMHKWTENEQA